MGLNVCLMVVLSTIYMLMSDFTKNLKLQPQYGFCLLFDVHFTFCILFNLIAISLYYLVK